MTQREDMDFFRKITAYHTNSVLIVLKFCRYKRDPERKMWQVFFAEILFKQKNHWSKKSFSLCRYMVSTDPHSNLHWNSSVLWNVQKYVVLWLTHQLLITNMYLLILAPLFLWCCSTVWVWRWVNAIKNKYFKYHILYLPKQKKRIPEKKLGYRFCLICFFVIIPRCIENCKYVGVAVLWVEDNIWSNKCLYKKVPL